ncbi:MFS transporter [Bacteroides sp. 519]|uniref:MFS transporter n=1 Tax=Bacteroides sp. 519 TaxID=2302937 RepID=UPI0013D48311|nr:MFS transporter [Bacteroides sp. 519]NDV60303.1 MFS transporter [Bacteroides sp. 519]
MEQKKQNGNLIAIITMCFIFAMISFVTNMAAPFGNIWGHTYSWAGMMGNMMNFAAYLFMGIPAGKMLVKYGYKKTALMALGVGVVGLLVQYLSSEYGADVATFTYDEQIVALNLIIYLLGAFICGFCVCMLNTVVNPMLNYLGGGGNKGNQLIQIGGTLNSLTGTLTPLLVGVLIGQVTEKTSMSDVAPLLFIGIGVFVLSFIIISFVKIVEPQQKKNEKYEHSPLAFRHCLLGIIAIFFYVGIEIGIPAQLNFYITGLGFEGSAAVGGTLAASYWFLMLIGRASSSIISGKVSTTTQMTIVSGLAIALLLIGIFMPDTIVVQFKGNDIPVKCFLIAACGLCTSIMWGGIFNLAVEGLGKYTAAASGLFMMMVVGGGVMPLIQDFIAKATNPITSYWLVIAMLVYILYYSRIGHKNVNKDIPVE